LILLLLVSLYDVLVVDTINASKHIFAPVFGARWRTLGAVLKTHYRHKSFSNDKVVVEGLLDVECKGVFHFLKPFYRAMGIVPAVTESQVQVTVAFESALDSAEFHFNRHFAFKQHRPYEFRSRMICTADGRVIEIMRFGVCWLSEFSCSDNAIKMQHKGYALRMFGKVVPIPVTWLFGAGYGEETVVDDEQFDMQVSITHGLFGKIYGYHGRFKVISK